MNEYKLLKILKYSCLISLILFISTLLLQMYVSNSTALKGKDFVMFYDKKKSLEKEIALLKYEESSLSSLSSIEARSAALGFITLREPIASISPASLASLNNR